MEIRKGDYFLFNYDTNEYWGSASGIIIVCSRKISGCVYGIAVSPPIRKSLKPIEANFGEPDEDMEKL